MTHEVLIDQWPDHAAEGMQPFNVLLQRRMSLGPKKAPRLTTVGLRCAGYFSFEGDAQTSDDAVQYGLRQAILDLSDSRKIDYDALFGKKIDTILPAVNEALFISESLVRITGLQFCFVEYCIPDNSAEPRYEGILIGKNDQHRIAAYKPTGIAGEWQCVCGSFNPPDTVCTCGLEKPSLPF